MNLRHTLAIISLVALPLGFVHAQNTPPAMITLSSTQNVEATVASLSQAFTNRGMTIFTVIDHQAAAHQAGLSMQPAKVIIYGNPKAGTPLMRQDPHFALKLPLKVLVTEHPQGQTKVVFESTHHLIQNSTISHQDVENTLAQVENLIINTIHTANKPTDEY